MSRAKFEEWAANNLGDIRIGGDGLYLFPSVQDAWMSWLAGRESMRDEAAEIADLMLYECSTLTSLPPMSGAAYAIARDIRKIEP